MGRYIYPSYTPPEDDCPGVYCCDCGKFLMAATDTAEGDYGFLVNGDWYCEDCAMEEFKREVFV